MKEDALTKLLSHEKHAYFRAKTGIAESPSWARGGVFRVVYS